MAKNNVKEMPRLFPQVTLPKFELTSMPAGGVTRDPATKDLDTFLELSMASGYSPGAYLVFAEIETARTMNPLAQASKSKRDANGRIIGLEENGSARGMFMFIDATWDRILNSDGNRMLRMAGVKDGEKGLTGNRIFKDDNFTDQQIVDIVRQHTDRDTVIGGIPKVRGSDELMSLRANTKLIGLAKTMLNDETLEQARNLGVEPTLGILYQGHVFGSLTLSASAGRGNGSAPASSLFSNAVVDANKHLFTGTVNDTLSVISSMTDARAAKLEEKYYGTVFTVDNAERKRLETPREFLDANNRPAKVAPGMAIQHNTLVQFVQERKTMHADMVGYDAARKAAKTPEEIAKAEAMRNLSAQPRVESFLKRTGYIETDAKGKPTATVDEALAEFRRDAGVAPGRPGFYDRTTLTHIQRAEESLSKFATLQAQQAIPAQPEIKAKKNNPGQPAIAPAPGVLDLRHMQKEQAAFFTTKDRKVEIADQVVGLKKELVAAGLLAQPTEKQKVPYTDAKGKVRTKFEDKPREFDAKRDGKIDGKLLDVVSKAQADHGLKPTAVVDGITKSELKKAPPPKKSYSIGIPVAEAKERSKVSNVPSVAPKFADAGPVGQQVHRMSALAQHLQPGDGAPFAAIMKSGLAGITPQAGVVTFPTFADYTATGPRSNFAAASVLGGRGAEPVTFAATTAYAMPQVQLEQVDLSRLTSLAEPAATATAPTRIVANASKPPTLS